MIKLNEVLSKDVINYSGKKSGKVVDVIYDKKTMKIRYLVVASKKGLFKKHYLFKLNQINVVSDVILISNTDICISRVKLRMLKKYSLKQRLDQIVYSKDAQVLGNLKDVVFNHLTGEINALIITNGAINDLINGRRIVLVDKNTKFAKNIIIANDDFEILNQATIKGLLR